MNNQLDINKQSVRYVEILEKADKLYGEGEFQKALSILNQIPIHSSEYSTSLFMKSMILSALGNNEKSFSIFTQFISEKYGDDSRENDGDFKELFYKALDFFYNSKNFLKAIEYFNFSLRVYPNHCEVLYFKALAYFHLFRVKKAVKVINKAIKACPENPKYWETRGVFFSSLNYVSKAHDSFDRAIGLKESSGVWANKAALYYGSDNFDRAIECFKKAIELNPHDRYSLLFLGGIYSELEDFDNADKCFDVAADIDGSDLNYLVEMGKHQLNKSEFKKSIEYFDRCLEIDETFASVWMFKSMALSELGFDEESQKCFNRAVELNPDSIGLFDEVVVIED